jgi:hypothetical protein
MGVKERDPVNGDEQSCVERTERETANPSDCRLEGFGEAHDDRSRQINSVTTQFTPGINQGSHSLSLVREAELSEDIGTNVSMLFREAVFSIWSTVYIGGCEWTNMKLVKSCSRLCVLGAGREVGRSCTVLKYRGNTIMFDCGVHPQPGFTSSMRSIQQPSILS